MNARSLLAMLVAILSVSGVNAGHAQDDEADASGPPGFFPSDTIGDGPWVLDTDEHRVRVSVVAAGLESPWGLAFLPNGDMLVTERAGRLRVIRDGVLDPTPIAGLPEMRVAIFAGLFDVALHPDFENNRLIYVAYAKPDPDVSDISTTAVARARWDGGSALTDVEDVFVAKAWYGNDLALDNNRCCGQPPPDTVHGGRLLFDAAGRLFVTLGDRGWGERAQEPSSHFGKIVRLNDDGSVPADNPFVGVEGYRPEIYSLGHRSPLGLATDPATGALWATEFGPRGGDELNRIEAGGNYGWMLVGEGVHYDGTPMAQGANAVDGMTDPVRFWAPTSINPSNLAFYQGAAFPAWGGDLLIATLSSPLARIRFDDAGAPAGEELMLTDLGRRFRDVREGPDGLVYLLTDEVDGALLRIELAE